MFSKHVIILVAVSIFCIFCRPALAGWEPLVELTAPDPCENAYFGYSVSIENSTAVVGAYGRNGNQGAVYVYDSNGLNNWNYVTTLLPPDLNDTDQFGYSVCINANRILVGVNANDANEVYVFDYNGTEWDTDPEVLSVASPDAYFGRSVSMDGNSIVVGALGNNDQAGAAYVFGYNGVEWSYKQELTDPCSIIDADFGCSVAVDGNIIVVGADKDDASDNGIADRHGAVCIFRYNGETWAFEQNFEYPDIDRLAHLGCSVSVSGDTIVAGAYQYSFGAYKFSGAAYVYKWNGSSWDLNTILIDPNPETNDQFGSAVAIDGNTIIVGNMRHDGSGTNSGAAYLYKWDGDSWSEGQILEDPSGAAYDYFGCSVAIDGDTTLVGAKWDDGDGGENNSGAAFIFLFLVADLNHDGLINLNDFTIMAEQWQQLPGEPSADISPLPFGDNIVNMWDVKALAEQWLRIGSPYIPSP
jgi:hypothetical protein